MRKLFSIFTVLALVFVLAACQTTTYTVTFNSNGGQSVPAVTVESGKKLPAPTAPTRTGYTFDGWYKESGLTNEWKFDIDVVTEDITLYAKWLMDGPTDIERVDAVYDWINIGDISALTNQSPRLILPATRDQVTITWSIDKPNYIQSNGIIVQPEASVGDQVVTLTATITYGAASRTKTFTATVLALPDVNEMPNVIEEYFDYPVGLIADTPTMWAPVSGKAGSSVYTIVNAISGTTIPGEGKALKVEAFTERTLEAAMPHTYDVLVIEMHLMQSASSNGSPIHIQSSSSAPAIGFGLNGTTLYYRVDNGAMEGITVQTNQWYKIRLEVDLVNKTIQLFYFEDGQLIQVTPGKVSFTTVTGFDKLFIRSGSSDTTALRAPAYVTGIVANRPESLERPVEGIKLGSVSGISETISLEKGQVFTPQIGVIKNLYADQRTLISETDYTVTVNHEVNVDVPGDYVVTYLYVNVLNPNDTKSVTQTVTIYSEEEPNTISDVTSTPIPYLGQTSTIQVNVVQPSGELYYLLSDQAVETAAAIKAGTKVDITSATITLSDLLLDNKAYIHVIVVLNGDSNIISHALSYQSVVHVNDAQSFINFLNAPGSLVVVLDNDIDLTGLTYTPSVFAGILDGQGHTITGLTYEGTGKSGMFSVFRGTIMNLTIKDANINSSNDRAGILGGEVDVTTAMIENIIIKDSYVKATHDNGAGTLFGLIVDGKGGLTANNIYVTNSIVVNSNKNAGGLIGYVRGNGDTIMSNIHVENVSVTALEHAGGLFGYVRNPKSFMLSNAVVNNVTVNASPNYASALIGRVDEATGAIATLKDVIVMASSATAADYLGVVTGRYVIILDNVFSAQVTFNLDGTVRGQAATTDIENLSSINEAWWSTNLPNIANSPLWVIKPDGSVRLVLNVLESEKVYYEVSFENDVTIEPITVESGKKVILPENPTKEGYTFEGWFVDEALLTAFDPDQAITANTVLYAKWAMITEPIYTVTFEVNEGSAIDPQQVINNEVAVMPVDPTKLGYIFGGWYIDMAFEQPFDFDTLITANITLYAMWIETVTVTFETNSGEPMPAVVLEKDTLLVVADPLRAGFAFLGWYVDVSLETPFDALVPITSNITLYAKWESNVIVISTAEDFIAFLNAPGNDAYQLGADIDLTGLTFTPGIFAGMLDGQGFKISNLTFNGTGRAGMFAYLRGSVSNIIFENPSITTSNDRAGVIAAEVDAVGVVIENIKVINATVSANSGNGAGTLVGLVKDGAASLDLMNIIVDTASITNANKNSGALVGYWRGTSDSTLTNFYIKDVTITATEHAGGITGYAPNPKSLTITNGYLQNVNVVVSPNYGSPLIGRVDTSSIVAISNVVVVNGQVQGTRYLGIVTGRYQVISLQNVYSSNVSFVGRADEGQNPTEIIVDPLTLDQTWWQANLASMTNNPLWVIETDGSVTLEIPFPSHEPDPEFYIVSFSNNVLIEPILVEAGSMVILPVDPILEGFTFEGWFIDEALLTPFDSEQVLTSDLVLYAKWVSNILVITTAEDFIQFLNNPGDLEVELGADIDLEGLTFTPGTFTGSLDGKGFTISNLSYTGANRGGLFAFLRGSVRNLIIDTVDIEVVQRAGVIAAEVDALDVVIENIIIRNAYVSGNDANGVGGVVGYVKDGSASVYMNNLIIENSSVTNVNKNAGGIVGYLRGNGDSVISNFMITGTYVYALEHAGGVAGYIRNPLSASIFNGYLSAISVEVNPNYGSPIIGRVDTTTIASVSNVIVLDSIVTGTRYLDILTGRYTVIVSEDVFASNVSFTGTVEGQSATLIITDPLTIDSGWYKSNMADLELAGWNLESNIPVLDFFSEIAS